MRRGTAPAAARPVTIETARLRLREWQPGDAEPYARLLARPQPGVAGRGPVSRVHVEAVCAGFLWDWRRHGVGPFAVLDRGTGEWLGRLGMSRRPGHAAGTLAQVRGPGPGGETLELSYELDPRWRGRGLATEGGMACLAFGFEALGAGRIAGRVDPGNAASGRVMEKLGLVPTGPAGGRAVWYAIERSAWRLGSTRWTPHRP